MEDLVVDGGREVIFMVIASAGMLQYVHREGQGCMMYQVVFSDVDRFRCPPLLEGDRNMVVGFERRVQVFQILANMW